MTETVRRHWIVTILAMIFCLMIGCATALIIGRTQPTYWIIYCGNTQGQGQCAPDFVSAGWVSEGNFTTVQWQADIGAGNTEQQVRDAMPAGHAAYSAHCGPHNCVIAGFSDGAAPALRLSSEVGLNPDSTYLFGAPQPSTGVFHHYAPDNPFVAYWIQGVMGLNEQQLVQPGMQAFYDSRDQFGDAAPQCTGPGLYALGQHYIISVAQSSEHVWTGRDGVVMHEANYAGAQGVPRSGSDPSQPWDLCPLSGWFNQAGEVPPPVAGGTGPQEPGKPVGTLPVPSPGAVTQQPGG